MVKLKGEETPGVYNNGAELLKAEDDVIIHGFNVVLTAYGNLLSFLLTVKIG